MNLQVSLSHLGWAGRSSLPSPPPPRKISFTLLRYQQRPQWKQMPLIMFFLLKICPYLPHCLQTHNKDQVTAQLKQETTVCTQEANMHIKRILAPTGRNQGTHLGVALEDAGADKAECTTAEGRFY